jgi:hypothetical protein
LAERPLESCSLGERQRVLIARALYGRHERLLFDEPAAGLSPTERAELTTFLRDQGIKNVVVLSGDIHAAFAGTIMDDFDTRHPPPRWPRGGLGADRRGARRRADDGVLRLRIRVEHRRGRWTASAVGS